MYVNKPDIIRGQVACMGERKGSYRDLEGKPEGKRLRLPRHRLQDMRMDLKRNWFEGIDWSDLAQDRDKWQPLVNR
jgi:hypothetical protein